MTDLLECKQCKENGHQGEPQVWTYASGMFGLARQVSCPCGACASMEDTREEAELAWNRKMANMENSTSDEEHHGKR